MKPGDIIVIILLCPIFVLFYFFQLSDLPRAFLRLAKNPLYICLVVGMSFDIYMSGFYTFLPKYIEKHFKKTPALASVVAGMLCFCYL